MQLLLALHLKVAKVAKVARQAKEAKAMAKVAKVNPRITNLLADKVQAKAKAKEKDSRVHAGIVVSLDTRQPTALPAKCGR